MQCNPVWKSALLVLFFVVCARSQALPPGKHNSTEWLLDTEFGSESGMGFKLPHTAFGVGFERSAGKSFEVQASIRFSPDKKYITNDGNSFVLRTKSVFWMTNHFGVTAGVVRGQLWTSQFTKGSWSPAIGISLKERSLDFPGRLYINYLAPTGCEWGPGCPMQSNRTHGPELEWEKLVWEHMRWGLHFGVYHVLNQSNPLRPDIPRTGQWTGDSYVIVRYQFHRGSLNKLY
jgi:hypothetical protein